MSVLEQTFLNAYPLLLIRLEDIAGGDGSQVQTALRLKQFFRENPYRVLCQEKAGKYRELVEKMGFKTDGLDYSDLTKIMDPAPGCVYAVPAEEPQPPAGNPQGPHRGAFREIPGGRRFHLQVPLRKGTRGRSG